MIAPPVSVQEQVDELAQRFLPQQTGSTQELLPHYQAYWSYVLQEINQVYYRNRPAEALTQFHCLALSALIRSLVTQIIGPRINVFIERTIPLYAVIGSGYWARGTLPPYNPFTIHIIVQRNTSSASRTQLLAAFEHYGYPVLESLGVPGKWVIQAQADYLNEAQRSLNTLVNYTEMDYITGVSKLARNVQKSFWQEMEQERGGPLAQKLINYFNYKNRSQNQTVYLQEPNLVNNLGGIHDYYLYQLMTMSLPKAVVRTLPDIESLETAYQFIQRAWNDLSLSSETAHGLVGLNNTQALAWNLSYKREMSRDRSVAFMHELYEHFGTIHDAIRAAYLISKETTGKGFSQTLKSLFYAPVHEAMPRFDGFSMVRPGVLRHDREACFQENPSRLMRIFRYAQASNSVIHPETQTLIRKQLHLIDEAFRQDQSVNKTFRSILQTTGNVHSTLSLMHQLGVLFAFIPECSHLKSLLQEEIYHYYTADVHCLKSIEILDRIFQGDADLEPYHNAIRKTTRPTLLYIMLLLHNIGKTALESENYQETSAVKAEPLLRLMGINKKQRHLILTVIRNQLLFPHAWHHLNYDEVEDIEELVKSLQDPETLYYLYVFTYCDFKSTHPNLWDEFKSNRHHHIFKVIVDTLGNQFGPLEARKEQKKAYMRTLIKKENPYMMDEEIDEQVYLHPERYFLLCSQEEIDLHQQMLFELRERISKQDCSGAMIPIINWKYNQDQALTAVTLTTWDRLGFFHQCLGAIYAAGFKLVSTKVITRSDKIAINVFYISKQLSEADQEQAKIHFIRQLEAIILKDKNPLPALVSKYEKSSKRINFSPSPTRTKIDLHHDATLRRTILEMESSLPQIMVYEIATQLCNMEYDILYVRIVSEQDTLLITIHFQKVNTEEQTSPDDLVQLRTVFNHIGNKYQNRD